MTESQVESILGKPADLQFHPRHGGLPISPGTNPEWEKNWFGKKKSQFRFFWVEADNATPTIIYVHFDFDGKVCNKGFSPGGISVFR
jgi:hypothetical protein